jgi:phage-related protein
VTGSPIAEAFVEVRADLSKIDADGRRLGDEIERSARIAAERGIDGFSAFEGGFGKIVARGIDEAGQGFVFFEKQSREGAERAAAALTSGLDPAWQEIGADAARAGESIEAAMAEAKRGADESLSQIGDADVWSELTGEAERAGEKIEGSMAEAARQSNAHLDGISATGQGAFGKLGGAVGLFSGALAAAGLGFFLSDSVSSATEAAAGFAELEQIIAATGGAAGLTAEQVASIASQQSVKIGIDDDDIIAAQGVLLTFKNIGGDVFPEVSGLAADMSAVFGGDLSGSATQLGKALNDPVAGISALSRVGVTFTEDQKEMIKALVEGGDVAGAQRVILDELQGQVGGAAEASATGAAKIGTAFGELKETLGGGIAAAIEGFAPQLVALLDQLQPVIGFLGETLGQFVGPLMDAFGPAIGQTVRIFSGLLTDVASVLESLTPAIEPVMAIVGLLAKTIGGALRKAFQAIEPLIVTVADFFVEFSEPVGQLIDDLVDALVPVLGTLAQVLSDVLGAVLPIITELFAALAPIIQGIVDVLAGSLVQVLPIIGDAFIQIADAVRPMIPLLQDSLQRIFEALVPILPSLIDSIVSIALSFLQVHTALLPLLPPLLELFTLLVEEIGAPVLLAIADAIAFMAENFAELAVQITDGVQPVIGFLTGVIEKLQELPAKVRDFVNDAIGWFKELPGRAQDALSEFAPRVVNRVVEMATGAVDAVSGFVSDAVDFFTGLPGRAVDALSSLAGDVAGSVAGMATAALSKATQFVTDVVTEIAGLPGRVVRGLASLGADLAGAISDAATAATGAASDLVGDVLGFFTSLPGNILSALGDVGRSISDGLYDSFKGAWNRIVGTLRVSIPIPYAPDVNLDLGKYLKLSNGAILTGPTRMLGGEAGPEAVIPMSRPGRAMELMQESGLGQMWEERMGAQAGGGPLVAIGSAVFHDATDAELVAQLAYAAQSARSLAA